MTYILVVNEDTLMIMETGVIWIVVGKLTSMRDHRSYKFLPREVIVRVEINRIAKEGLQRGRHWLEVFFVNLQCDRYTYTYVCFNLLRRKTNSREFD